MSTFFLFASCYCDLSFDPRPLEFPVVFVHLFLRLMFMDGHGTVWILHCLLLIDLHILLNALRIWECRRIIKVITIDLGRYVSKRSVGGGEDK